MEKNTLTIWIDIPTVKIKHKVWHIHKIGKKSHRDITKDCGDLPVGCINVITNKLEEVVNNRGYGYAARRRMKYRKSKKELCFRNVTD